MSDGSDTQVVTVQNADGVATITLNRPSKRNALSLAMRTDLCESLARAHADPACRAIVLTGAGAAFCGGADMRETQAQNKPDMETRRHRMALLQDVARQLIAGPKPTIAAVRGSAYGAGFSLALACDRIIATHDAKFCAVFARVGLSPDAGIMWTLPRRVGDAAARHMFFTGESISAEDALAIGLIDEMVSEDALPAATARNVALYAQSAPLAIAAIKAAQLSSLEDVLRFETEVQFKLSDTEDSEEAKRAFFAKRKPVFVGR